MSPAVFSRSPEASTIRVSLGPTSQGAGSVTRPAFCRIRQHLGDLLLDRQPLHVAVFEGPQLFAVEAGGGFGDALEREVLDHLLAGKILGLVVERPAEQHQVVDDRVGQIADLAVEIDDHRVERLGSRDVADAGGDLGPVVVEPFEFGVLQVLGDFSLRQLLRAARLGDVGQVGVLGQRIAERLGDENLPRRVREVLDGADDVRDLEIEVIDDAGQVIEARAVGPLDDVVLLFVPVELAHAANRVVEDALAFARHLQPHDLRCGPRP